MTQVVLSRSLQTQKSHSGFLCGVLAALMLVGCSDDEPDDYVSTRSNASADFTSYDTFAFPNPSAANQAVVNAIPGDVVRNLDEVNDAVRQQLIEEGLTEVSPDADPDLMAVSLASTEEQSGYTWACVDGGFWGYWTYAYDPCAWLQPIYTEYTEGTVVVALLDPEAEEVVFGGVLEGVLEDGEADDIEERIDDGVAEMFDTYPSEQAGLE